MTTTKMSVPFIDIKTNFEKLTKCARIQGQNGIGTWISGAMHSFFSNRYGV